jgi:hypothetical protein
MFTLLDLRANRIIVNEREGPELVPDYPQRTFDRLRGNGDDGQRWLYPRIPYYETVRQMDRRDGGGRLWLLSNPGLIPASAV